MNKYTAIKIIALLLCMIFLSAPLAGCAQLEEFFKEGSESGDNSSTDSNKDNDKENTLLGTKKAGVYTVLMLSESKSAGTLQTIAVASFDTVEGKQISFLQIPTRLFISGSEVTMGAVYSSAYSKAIADYDTVQRAREKGVSALKSVISEKLGVYIDYSMLTDPKGINGIVTRLGGVEMTFPYAIALSAGESIAPGKQTVSGERVELLLNNNSFDGEKKMNFQQMLISAIAHKAKTSVSNEMISLFVLDIKNFVTTDIPSVNGEDIFFIRQLVNSPTASVRFTRLPTQSCAVSAGIVDVMNKTQSLESVFEFLSIFKEKPAADKFDAEGYFNNKDNPVVNTIYTSSGSQSKVYTVTDAVEGKMPL